MNTTKLSMLTLFMTCLTAMSGCDDAVVGRNGEDASTVSLESLCQDLGHEICQQACLCGGSDGCIVGTGNGASASSQVYDSLAHCEEFYVTLACLNPANPASYYQDCLGTTSSCESRSVGAQSVQAAALSASCQNPNGFGIACGDATCARIPADDPGNEVCCVTTESDTSHTATCQAPEAVCEGPSLELTFACDGPEDCAGTSCCGSAASGIACTTQPSCDSGVAQYCHRNADCPDGFQCIDASISGFEFRVCANP